MLSPVTVALSLLLATPALEPGKVWAGFRGRGDSHSPAKSVPVRWSDTENVAWSVELSGYGQSSPVVWGDRVFVTSVAGEMQDRLLARCLDLGSGKTLWEREFKGSQGVKTSDYVSKAAPTPVVDAERVYLFFESGDLIALTHAGQPVWQRSLVREYGVVKSNHGLGSSPVLAEGKLLVLVSQDTAPYLLAAEAKTGATLWKREHPFGAGWSTPVVAEHEGRRSILVSTSGRVDAFDFQSGEPLWSVQGLKGNTVPSPSLGAGVAVIGSSERGSTLAVKLGGKGEVTQTHISWRQPEVVSSFGSPLVHEGLVYLTNRTGVAYCLDVATGKARWETRLPASSWASPALAEGWVYFLDTNGNALVVKAGPTLEKIAENRFTAGGRVYGFAVVDGAFVFRTGNRVVRIGKP